MNLRCIWISSSLFPEVEISEVAQEKNSVSLYCNIHMTKCVTSTAAEAAQDLFCYRRYIAVRMAEWSKVLQSGRISSGGVGLDLTSDIKCFHWGLKYYV